MHGSINGVCRRADVKVDFVEFNSLLNPHGRVFAIFIQKIVIESGT